MRLLQEAYRAYVQERYPTAARFFQRFLDDFPEAIRSPEARWWLGRSLEQVGNVRAAVEQYQILATSPPNGLAPIYGAHASRRLVELKRARADDAAGVLRQVAVRIGIERLPQPAAREEWLGVLAQIGATAVVVEPTIATGSDSMTSRMEELTGLTSDAHRLGLQIWLALDVHQPKGFRLKPEWVSVRDGAGLTDTTMKPDVTHPDYQAYLEEMLRHLATGGCDGIVLLARASTGFSGDYSDGAFRVFAEVFGLTLSPQEVLHASQGPGAMSEDRIAVYWRWVGWRAGRYSNLAERLRRVLRQSNPLAMVLVEVHSVALEAPLQALEQYGEDVAELMRSGVALVFRQEEMGESTALDRLGQQIKNPDRLWVSRSLLWPTVTPSADGLRQLLKNVRETARWNLLVDADALLPFP